MPNSGALGLLMQTSHLAPRRRLWPVFIAPGLFFLLAAGWSAFWFYAASQIDTQFEGWRTREAKAGRIYECEKQSVGGFPFRMEVRCENPLVTLTSQTSQQVATSRLTVRLKEILVLAQIYDPTKIIAEFTGPVTVAAGGPEPQFGANWTLGQASAAGLPIAPQRISMAFDNPTIDRMNGAVPAPLLRASHLELHTRLLDGSLSDNPVVETAFQLTAGSLQGLHPILAQPFDAEIRAQLRGLKDLSPKPWPERFREIQSANGRLDFTQSRVQQGDVIAVAAGSLAITPDGYLDGELAMTVAGMERIVPMLGIDKAFADNSAPPDNHGKAGVNVQDVNKLIGALDRVIPGLGDAARKNANAGVMAGINMLGKPSTLEGRSALSFPLRFVNGAVLIGPLRVAQTPPLF
jgi:hypothetical protein